MLLLSPSPSVLSPTRYPVRMPKRAGVLLMVTGGEIGPRALENFETACVVDEPLTIHPFAFRTHTHNHGIAVSGWRVRRDDDGADQWTLIGKKDPKKPQMFYPVPDPDMVIEESDVIAARCHMENGDYHPVGVGFAAPLCLFLLLLTILPLQTHRGRRDVQLLHDVLGGGRPDPLRQHLLLPGAAQLLLGLPGSHAPLLLPRPRPSSFEISRVASTTSRRRPPTRPENPRRALMILKIL